MGALSRSTPVDAPVSVPAATAIWPVGIIHDVADAILYTLVYADLFDYPMSVPEIHRYLTCHSASLAAIEEALAQNVRLTRSCASRASFWFLEGREHLVGLRQEREAFCHLLRRQAKRYAHLAAAVPFVRMVGLTGSLAMNNARGPRDDIDFLIIAAPGRVWLARGLIILIVHLARRLGVEVCPNYVMADHCLELEPPSLFSAHELAQLVPLYGLHTYRRLLESNAWMTMFLPNASPQQASVRDLGAVLRAGKRVLEGSMGGRLGDALERWEGERKIPRLRQIACEQGSRGASYTPDLCKGHADDHAASIGEKYAARLAAYGL